MTVFDFVHHALEIMAGLIQRGNFWYATFYCNGKNVRRALKIHVQPEATDKGETARTLKRRAQLAAEAMEELHKGTMTRRQALQTLRAAVVGASCPTVEEFAARWLPTQQRKKSYPTCRKAITRFLARQEQERTLPMDTYTEAMAQDYAVTLLDVVSGSTVERDCQEISAMFNRAIAERVIEFNPFRSIKLPAWARKEKQDRVPFTSEQLQQIFTKFPQEWADMVAVCLLTGAQRLGDVATLKWEQINWQWRLVKLTTQKQNRPMLIPIIPQLETILRRRHGGIAGGSPFIFPLAAARYGQAGGKASKLSIDFLKLLKEHNILTQDIIDLHTRQMPMRGNRHRLSPLSFHSLRSTATTFLLDAGVPHELVMHIVGHDSADIELKHYYKPSQEAAAAAMAAMAKVLNIEVPS